MSKNDFMYQVNQYNFSKLHFFVILAYCEFSAKETFFLPFVQTFTEEGEGGGDFIALAPYDLYHFKDAATSVQCSDVQYYRYMKLKLLKTFEYTKR